MTASGSDGSVHGMVTLRSPAEDAGEQRDQQLDGFLRSGPRLDGAVTGA